MLYRFKSVIILMFVLFPAFFLNKVRAQGQDKIWIFGNFHGLDFTTGVPVPLNNTAMDTWEAAGSICNAAGNLLFYSNAQDVWDANGNIMPNGSGILGYSSGGSTTEGAGIVQSVANPSQYYLFTMEDFAFMAGGGIPKLRYSVIDMNLNGGMGDVLPNQKNIELNEKVSEQMAVTAADNCEGYWLLVRNYETKEFIAYKIDANGISAPVISPSSGTPLSDHSVPGEMKFSPDGTKIAWIDQMARKIELGSFNKQTGSITNVIAIPQPLTTTPQLVGNGSFYGLSFSPDGSKLYMGPFKNFVRQYDITAYPNLANIQATMIDIVPANSPLINNYCGMRIGPDNKIYILTNTSNNNFNNTPSVSVINNPNAAGIACNITPNAIPLVYNQGFESNLGFQTAMLSGTNGITYHSKDTSACAPLLVLKSPSAFGNVWNTGATSASIEIYNSGTYWVKSQSGCTGRVDTFHVTMLNDVNPNILGNDTTICAGASLLLNATAPGCTYQWQDGSSEPTFNVTEGGTYIVAITKNGCTKSDTIRVRYEDDFLKIRESDTVICEGKSITLNAETSASDFRWNNGATSSTIHISMAGEYTLSAQTPCGILKDSVQIGLVNCACTPLIPNAFSPNGDALNDVFKLQASCPLNFTSFSVYNRYGEKVFSSVNNNRDWDGLYNGKACDAGVYFYYLQYTNLLGETRYKKGDITLIR